MFKKIKNYMKRAVHSQRLKTLALMLVCGTAACLAQNSAGDPYIMYGDADNLSDEEQKLVDDFLDKNFPDVFTPDIVDGTEKELNLYPAFGTRNENALPNHGESPYQAVDTVSVKFGQACYFESRSEEEKPDYAPEVVTDNSKEEVAAKEPPRQDVDEEYHPHFGR
jgi:hypothetical protein